MPLAELLCAAVLVASCLLGGSAAPGRILILGPEMLSLPLMAYVLSGPWASGRTVTRFVVVGMILALPLLQLMPLPPRLWSVLPGHSGLADVLATAGLPPPWAPISLTPGDTERMLFGLLPASALFLAMPSLDWHARRRLLSVVLAIGLASVLLGVVQVASGLDSPLRFYGQASRLNANGFFANRNHYAAFLYMLIPLTFIVFDATDRSRPNVGLLALVVAVLLGGIVSSGSRAGLALGLAAALASALSLRRERWRAVSARWKALIIVVAVLCVLTLLVALGLMDVLLRFRSANVADDLRWQIDRTTLTAISTFFPFGSGFGSFERVYAMFEKPADLIPAIINNAHDDWLELVLEGGLPALLLLSTALVYLVRRTLFAAPRRAVRPAGTVIERLSLIILWLCAIHSIVDYPLRTMGINVIFALVCGLLCQVEAPPTTTAAITAVGNRRRRLSGVLRLGLFR